MYTYFLTYMKFKFEYIPKQDITYLYKGELYGFGMIYWLIHIPT